MTASLLGIGLLGFPSAYVNMGGIGGGILIQIPFIILCWIGLVAIAWMAEHYNIYNYNQLIEGKNNANSEIIIMIKIKFYSCKKIYPKSETSRMLTFHKET